MKVTLDRVNDNYLFNAKGKTGVPILIDNTSEEGAEGASPMELLLMGIGGCSAIDVISILKKQRQKIDSYHMKVEGFRKEVKEARPFERVHVKIFLEGDIAPAKAKRAGELSFEKYCSVSITMENSVFVSHEILINGKLVG